MKHFIVFVFVIILLGCDDKPDRPDLPDWAHEDRDDKVYYIAVGTVERNNIKHFEFLTSNDEREALRRGEELVALGLRPDTTKLRVINTGTESPIYIASLIIYYEWADDER